MSSCRKPTCLLNGEFLHEPNEIIPRELPLEGLRSLLVPGLESQYAGFDLARIREVIGGQDFALDNREVDLHLVEPGSMQGQVDQPHVSETSSHAADGHLAPMAGTDVDDPEDAPRLGIGRGRHDLVHQPVEGRNPGMRFAAPEELGVMAVPCGEILQRPTPIILVLDAHGPRLGGGNVG